MYDLKANSSEERRAKSYNVATSTAHSAVDDPQKQLSNARKSFSRSNSTNAAVGGVVGGEGTSPGLRGGRGGALDQSSRSARKKAEDQNYNDRENKKDEGAGSGDLICSIWLPWFGEMTLPRYRITGLQIKDYWLYVFTKQSFEIFVFDLNRIAFSDGSTGFKSPRPQKESSRTSWILRGAQEEFEEALVHYYLEHIEKDYRREQVLREKYGGSLDTATSSKGGNSESSLATK